MKKKKVQTQEKSTTTNPNELVIDTSLSNFSDVVYIAGDGYQFLTPQEAASEHIDDGQEKEFGEYKLVRVVKIRRQDS